MSDSVLKSTENERLAVVLTHFGGIFFGFIPSLLVYLIKDDGRIKENARHALNWQLTSILYFLISSILMLVFIGVVLYFIVILLNIFFCLLAAIRSSRGEEKRYPLTIEFIKDKSLELQV
ncbi:MAG: DUF4870 domain-containing protein [Methylococcaceae bacterium]|nr:MAG: DUF4870 domain-containing protein [Methylococcaceae bacterium]